MQPLEFAPIEGKLIWRDYSGKSDVVAEFVQNTDDFGATEVRFELSNQKFGKERVVDLRCAALQGPVLYILFTKELREEDTKHMQRVARSAKGFDFASAGRFGVGMNAMYRYSDCLQLFAHGHLDACDLTRELWPKTTRHMASSSSRKSWRICFQTVSNQSDP